MFSILTPNQRFHLVFLEGLLACASHKLKYKQLWEGEGVRLLGGIYMAMENGPL